MKQCILLLSAGSSIHTIRWANAFVERGRTVHLVTQHEPIHGLSAAVHVWRLPHHKGLGYLLNGGRLRRLIARIRPDVVNAHYATGYGTLARAVGAVPLVLNVWGSDVFDFPAMSAVHRAMVQRNLRRADAVVSTSEVMARRTRELCPGLRSLTVIPFGVETDRFSPRVSTVEPGTEVVIGTVKTLAPKYGIDTLIDAFARTLARTHSPINLRLRLVGGGGERPRLEAMAQRLGIQDRVAFVGAVDHARVPDELRKLDIYAALSREDSESFGVAVIEASACGLPVVVTNVGGLPEVVETGYTGFVVPKEDPAAAADRMVELVNDAALRQRMGAEGRHFVQQRYEWAGCVDRMLSVIDGTTLTD